MGRKYNTCFIMSRRQLALILCTHFAVTLCVSASFYHESNETSSAFPVYILATKADLLPNVTTCRRELEEFRNSVDRRTLWALKILDSSGKPESGFLYGNNFWLGSRSQCLDTTNKAPFPVSENLLNSTLYPEKEFPPFPVKYLVAYFKHNSTIHYHTKLQANSNEDVISLGLCLPVSCTEHDVTIILQEIFLDRSLQIGDLYSMDFKLIKVKTLTDDYHWLVTGAIPVICTGLVLTILMMMLGTLYDVLVQNYCTVTSSTQNVEEPATSSLRHQYRKHVGEMLRCFSVYTNTKLILKTTCELDTVSVIHGLRFLSMLWVIIIHTLLYSTDYIDNKSWILRFSDRFQSQVLSNGSLVVDTFFFLSGFLLTYLYLRNQEEEQEKSLTYRTNEFFGLILKRFIRLTPSYLMMLGIVQLASSWYDKTSTFYTGQHETCSTYWWTNLLYINNFYNINTICMSWTWYLANDTQFYIIGAVLLILSTVCFYMAIVIMCALLIGSTILFGYISYVYEYVPTVDETVRLSNVIYFPPWVRIGPYIIGMLTGFLIVRSNKTLVLKKRTVILCWCVGSTCNLLVLFGLYKRHISVLSAAVYTALSRPVWATGIAWILIACLTKNGGIVNQLLSFRGWIPFSRLTYTAYLINPFIIQLGSLNSETSMHFDVVPNIILSLGYCVATYLGAYALCLMTESPYILLSRVLFKSLRKREQKLCENITTMQCIGALDVTDANDRASQI